MKYLSSVLNTAHYKISWIYNINLLNLVVVIKGTKSPYGSITTVNLIFGGKMDIEKLVWERLEKVVDPEVPLNIVEMGLVYDVDFDENNGNLHIIMTLTIPGCPLHSKIKKDVEEELKDIEPIKNINVEFVFEPKWTIDMMTPEARKKIGK